MYIKNLFDKIMYKFYLISNFRSNFKPRHFLLSKYSNNIVQELSVQAPVCYSNYCVFNCITGHRI